jgi:hypothetical protein
MGTIPTEENATFANVLIRRAEFAIDRQLKVVGGTTYVGQATAVRAKDEVAHFIVRFALETIEGYAPLFIAIEGIGEVLVVRADFQLANLIARGNSAELSLGEQVERIGRLSGGGENAEGNEVQNTGTNAEGMIAPKRATPLQR